MRKLDKLESKIIKKGWGYELHIINNDMYCGKILHYNSGSEMSMHYHINKIETWYISKGRVMITGINPDSADLYTIEAKVGDVIHINRGVVHKVCAVEESEIFEISTPDDINDNYRVGKGNSQK